MEAAAGGRGALETRTPAELEELWRTAKDATVSPEKLEPSSR
jgi:hypothetical protein